MSLCSRLIIPVSIQYLGATLGCPHLIELGSPRLDELLFLAVGRQCFGGFFDGGVEAIQRAEEVIGIGGG